MTTTVMTAPNLAAQISHQLQTNKSLSPTSAWLQSFLATQRPTTPLTALVSTASFRLLNSDITTSLEASPATCLAPDIQNGTIQQRRLPGSIVVQVLEVEDMSKSRWEQIEAIEALERGEGVSGREIIRVVPTEAGAEPGISRSGGPHKVLLQDTKGAQVYGAELRAVEGISLGMSIGTKLVLKNVAVCRGVVMLEPGTVSVLGGKIEVLHQDWREHRKERLRAAIEATEVARA